MKYIRTKDGKISYLDTEPYEDEPNYVVITNKGKINFYRPNQVVKQADTIEELCDRYIYDEDVYFPRVVNGCLQTYDYEANDLEITKEMIKKGIYGAIWTDKGLIYVAKMNDKGELELL